jgi:hypothetical protein
MFVDAQCVLSDAQALAGAATTASTNAYDTMAAGNHPDTGAPLCVRVSVDVAADLADGDETYQFKLVQSANTDLSAPDILLETATAYITRAKLVAGYRFYLPIPSDIVTKRYIGLNYTLGGTTPSITVTADIRPMNSLQNEEYFASGYKIDS